MSLQKDTSALCVNQAQEEFAIKSGKLEKKTTVEKKLWLSGLKTTKIIHE